MRLIACPQWFLRHVRSSVPFAVISITDPEPDGHPAVIPANPMMTDLLRLEFHDFIWDEVAAGSHQYLGRPMRDWCMTPDHADRLAEFVRHVLDDGWAEMIVVHCVAGASRSPSIAMAICDHLRLPRSTIEWAESPASPPPNPHCYDLTMEALSLGSPVAAA